MTTLDQALSIIINHIRVAGNETIALHHANGRIIAQDVIADMDMPPFDKSAVDGYACRLADIENDLKLVATIAAGQSPPRALAPGECMKIMTGAPVPDGADCVLMVEDTELLPGNIIRYNEKKTTSNICVRGEDAREGEVMITAGTWIKPQHIAVMATFGVHRPVVSIRPKIGIISTGDELVEPDKTPVPGQIRNSNAWQLQAQASALPCEIRYYGIASDKFDDLLNLINNATNENDMILITGGISMGDFDLVPEVMLKAGYSFHFRSIAIQPGKPTIFSTRPDAKVCFALPGNPVSSFCQFELLVKPAILKMSGHVYKPLEMFLRLRKPYRRKKTGRLSIVPMTIDEESFVVPVPYHGSAHINALIHADGLMFVPIGTEMINEGELVRVRFI